MYLKGVSRSRILLDEIVCTNALSNEIYKSILSLLEINKSELYYCPKELNMIHGHMKNTIMISGYMGLSVPSVHIIDYTHERDAILKFSDSIKYKAGTQVYIVEVISPSYSYEYQMMFIDMEGKPHKPLLEEFIRFCEDDRYLKWSIDISLTDTPIKHSISIYLSKEENVDDLSKTIYGIFENKLLDSKKDIKRPYIFNKTAFSVLEVVDNKIDEVHIGKFIPRSVRKKTAIISGEMGNIDSVVIHTACRGISSCTRFHSCIYATKNGVGFNVKISCHGCYTWFWIYVLDCPDSEVITKKICSIANRVEGKVFSPYNSYNTIEIEISGNIELYDDACTELIKSFIN